MSESSELRHGCKVALARLVNSLKGVSARRVKAEGFPEVQRVLWGAHFWSPSYCASSYGISTTCGFFDLREP